MFNDGRTNFHDEEQTTKATFSYNRRTGINDSGKNFNIKDFSLLMDCACSLYIWTELVDYRWTEQIEEIFDGNDYINDNELKEDVSYLFSMLTATEYAACHC